MAVSFKGAHVPSEVILMGIRCYLAYPLSTRQVEELMEERGVSVAPSTIKRWVITYSPQLEAEFHQRKRSVWTSWCLDETSMKVKGEWTCLYRTVDKVGKSIVFCSLSSEMRRRRGSFSTGRLAAMAVYLRSSRSMAARPTKRPSKATTKENGTSIEIRQIKSLTNIVESDHRGVKRVTRPRLGFKSFESAPSTLIGIDLMHRLRQGQFEGDEVEGLSVAKPFYALASSSHCWVATHPQAPSEQNLRQNPLMPQPQIFHKMWGENVYVYSTEAVLSVLTSHRSGWATADAFGAAGSRTVWFAAHWQRSAD